MIPVTLSPQRVATIRERLPEAMFQSSTRTLSIRIFDEDDGDAGVRAAVTGLAEALALSRAESQPQGA